MTTCVLALLLVLGIVPEARAEEPGDAVPVDRVPAEVELRAAREAYVLGAYDEARDRFLALVQRARNLLDVDPEIEARAWVYLGEMQLLSGDRRAAEASFRMALDRAPDLRLSPVEHPEQIIGAFEVVRSAVISERSVAPPPPRPLPWWGYAPFGVPQFRQGKPVRGAVYAGLQVGFLAASITAYVVTDRAIREIDERPLPRERDQEEVERERAMLLRDGFQYPVSAAFYVTWAISAIDGGISWRRGQLAPSALVVSPRPGGAHLEVAWRF